MMSVVKPGRLFIVEICGIQHPAVSQPECSDLLSRGTISQTIFSQGQSGFPAFRIVLQEEGA